MKYFVWGLKWLALSVVDLLFQAFSLLFVNWWVPFTARKIVPADYLWEEADPQWRGIEEKLPEWLRWFETFDASLDTGWIEGKYFKSGEAYSPTNLPGFWRRKWYQIRWLYRNSNYGFSYWVTGVPMVKADWVIHRYVIQNGYRLFIALNPKTGYFNINLQGKYGTYKLGVKAWNYWDRDIQDWYQDNLPWGPEWRTQLVLSINPFSRTPITQ